MAERGERIVKGCSLEALDPYLYRRLRRNGSLQGDTGCATGVLPGRAVTSKERSVLAELRRFERAEQDRREREDPRRIEAERVKAERIRRRDEREAEWRAARQVWMDKWEEDRQAELDRRARERALLVDRLEQLSWEAAPQEIRLLRLELLELTD